MAKPLRFKINRRANGIKWTPLDTSLRGTIMVSTEKSRPRWRGRLAFRLRYLADSFLSGFWSRTLKAAIAASVSSSAYLYLVWRDRGDTAMLDEASLQWAWIKAALLGAAIVFVVDFLISLFRRRRTGGVWYDNKFVYDEPRRVLTVQVTSEDNDKAFPFQIPGALPGAYVVLRAEIEGGPEHIKTWFNLAPAAPNDWRHVSSSARGGLKLSSKQPVFLLTHCAPEAAAKTVRVYVLSVTYQDNIGVKHA